MSKHPTVDVPNVGPMDHAWDVLGEWHVEFEVPRQGELVEGLLRMQSWMEAELAFEPWGAAAMGLPERVTLERASRVHLTDAGGGALQWVFISSHDAWTVQATLWPGSLHLFVQHIDRPDDELYRAVGSRGVEYYRRKYPLMAR